MNRIEYANNITFEKYDPGFALLTKLFLDMPEVQQKQIIDYALKVRDLRHKKRIPCLIYTTYKINHNSYNGFVLDINIYGAFIETDQSFGIGRTMNLAFFDPFAGTEIRITGVIVRSTESGVGVDFYNYDNSVKKLENFLSELRKYNGKVIKHRNLFENISSFVLS